MTDVALIIGVLGDEKSARLAAAVLAENVEAKLPPWPEIRRTVTTGRENAPDAAKCL